MTEIFTKATQAEGVRWREEDGSNYLLYHPLTDQLHMISSVGKAIFDLCDGRSIDDIIHDGGRLLGSEDGDGGSGSQVLRYLIKLRERTLIEFE